MINIMKDRFSSLTPREQALLGILAVLLMSAIFWFWIFVPLDHWNQRAKQDYKSAALNAQQIRQAMIVAKSMSRTDQDQKPSSGLDPVSVSDIRTIVSQTTQAAGLSLSRIQPEQEKGLNVWLDDVDGRDLMAWLITLYNQHGISTAKVSLQRGKENTVRAQLLLVSTGSEL